MPVSFKLSRSLINISLLFFIGCQSPASAEATTYDTVSARYFWNKLYVNGGWTLYCGYNFSDLRKTADGKIVEVDHILPIAKMVHHAGCKNRMKCHESQNKLFLAMKFNVAQRSGRSCWIQFASLRAFRDIWISMKKA